MALAFLDGPWDAPSLRIRGSAALEQDPPWLGLLCDRLCTRFAQAPADAEILDTAILEDEPLREALPAHLPMPIVRRWFSPSPHMTPVTGRLANLQILPIETEGALAELLSLSAAELDWFADPTRRNVAATDERLRHYRYRWIAKRSGGVRLLETPKLRMKQIQRVLLNRVLRSIPPHDCAHGFVSGRSPLSFVRDHVGKRVVLRMDLEDFFPSITLARVRAIFARVGYPRSVARALAGLCCVPTPRFAIRKLSKHTLSVDERFRIGQRLTTAHLPQGSPTSPALSNLVAFKLDRRLHGLARTAGASYSRYADDLAFSGDELFDRGLQSFAARVAAIVIEEGFQVRHRKTRVMRNGARQSLCGLVINERAHSPRSDVDRLRALLHNAAKHGAASQNREGLADFKAHLEGRIAWLSATRPTRAVQLRATLSRIDWES